MHEYEKKVQAEVAKGLSMPEAVRRVNEAHPTLRAEYAGRVPTKATAYERAVASHVELGMTEEAAVKVVNSTLPDLRKSYIQRQPELV